MCHLCLWVKGYVEGDYETCDFRAIFRSLWGREQGNLIGWRVGTFVGF